MCYFMHPCIITKLCIPNWYLIGYIAHTINLTMPTQHRKSYIIRRYTMSRHAYSRLGLPKEPEGWGVKSL